MYPSGYVENLCKRLVMCLTTSYCGFPFGPTDENFCPPSKLANFAEIYPLFKRLCTVFYLSSKQVEHTSSRNDVSSWNQLNLCGQRSVRIFT